MGASRGIGAAITEKFLSEGFTVAATTRSGEVPDGALAITTDLLSPEGTADGESIKKVVETATELLGGAISHAVFNAGITRDNLLLRMREEDIRAVLETNLVAPMLFAQAMLRPMLKQKGGSLTFVTSMSARFGVPGQTNYTAAKAGLEGFVRSFSKEWIGRKIRANAVAPGPTDTAMYDALNDEQKAALLKDTPIGRPATPAEIADVVFGVSQFTYLSGASVPVSGGGGYGY